MPRPRVILLGFFAAVAYGVVHDQITARICLEYFSRTHPPIFPVHSLTMLALCWGVASTCFVGLAFGWLLALVSRSGSLPPVPFARLRRGVLLLLGTMAICATVSGVVGYALTRHGFIALPDVLEDLIPPDRRARFMAVWCVHIASYAAGFFGFGIWLFLLWRQRGSPRFLTLPALPQTRLGTVRATLLFALVAFVFYVRFVRR